MSLLALKGLGPNQNLSLFNTFQLRGVARVFVDGQVAALILKVGSGVVFSDSPTSPIKKDVRSCLRSGDSVRLLAGKVKFAVDERSIIYSDDSPLPAQCHDGFKERMLEARFSANNVPLVCSDGKFAEVEFFNGRPVLPNIRSSDDPLEMSTSTLKVQHYVLMLNNVLGAMNLSGPNQLILSRVRDLYKVIYIKASSLSGPFSDRVTISMTKTFMKILSTRAPSCYLDEDLKYFCWRDVIGARDTCGRDSGGKVIMSSPFGKGRMDALLQQVDGLLVRYWGNAGESVKITLATMLFNMKQYQVMGDRHFKALHNRHPVFDVAKQREMVLRSQYAYQTADSFFSIKRHVINALYFTQALLMKRDASISKEDHAEIVLEMFNLLPKFLQERIKQHIYIIDPVETLGADTGAERLIADPFSNVVIRGVREARYQLLRRFNKFLTRALI
ncbi:MAG: hypothetical protein P0S95_03295 [Rhabdochlamydiaceae bacterium]|nr:hypothetical protein [Candidatus Amphrikana amoebophyrae]